MAALHRAVIFDLGGVLIHWDPRLLYRKLLPDEESVETFLRTICTPEWNAKQDAGRPFPQGIADLATRFPEQATLIEAWYDRFEEMLSPMNDSIEILAELRQRKVPIYALSNWGAETFDIALEHFPFLDWFDGLVISGRVGVAKPDARIFHLLLKEHGLHVSEVVFVDDHLPNVEAATELGIDVVHFSSADQLRDDLGQRGFL